MPSWPSIRTQPYLEQVARWPKSGRHILAQFDDRSVVVYQAYAPAIGRFAAMNGWFGGEFGYGRMSWVKPNFLWMMYRSGWGTKDGQQVVLAIRIQRTAFDTLLSQAVHSTFVPEVHGSSEQWKQHVRSSEVRLQWDPDHGPHGEKLERRAIQLGLRGEVLRRYGREWIVGIEDVSELVAEQYSHVKARELHRLLTPEEHVYPVSDPDVAGKLGVEETNTE